MWMTTLANFLKKTVMQEQMNYALWCGTNSLERQHVVFTYSENINDIHSTMDWNF